MYITSIAHAHQQLPKESLAEPLTFFSAGGWLVILFTIFAFSLITYKKYLSKTSHKKKRHKIKLLPPLLYREDFTLPHNSKSSSQYFLVFKKK